MAVWCSEARIRLVGQQGVYRPMTRIELFERRIALTYKAFNDAAEEGRPAPTNMEIVAFCGYEGEGGGGVAR